MGAWIGFGMSVGTAALGAALGGLDQHWSHLFAIYLCSSCIVELHWRAGHRWLSWPCLFVVLGAGMYGLLWTVGFQRAFTLNATLVYIGTVGAIVFSLLVSLRSSSAT